MRAAEVEHWTLRIVDTVLAGHRVEDDRIELKADWPHPQRAARRIAAHANAARADAILWIIGVDENACRVVGVPPIDFASWYAQVTAEFNELAPDVQYVVVPTSGSAVASLLFDSSRGPYVVRNPEYGKPGAGPVALEVPWREGTGVRSATRSELIRSLLPVQRLPDIEVLGAKVGMQLKAQDDTGRVYLGASLYITPRTPDLLVIPRHRSQALLVVPNVAEPLSLQIDELRPQVRTHTERGGFFLHREEQSLSYTIQHTDTEVLISAAGFLKVVARGQIDPEALLASGDLHARLRFSPVEAERAVTVGIPLVRDDTNASTNEAVWVLALPTASGAPAEP